MEPTETEKLRILLRERCFWTGQYGPGTFSREGYSILVDDETCFRDVNRRNAPLWPTPDAAIDAVLNDKTYWFQPEPRPPTI